MAEGVRAKYVFIQGPTACGKTQLTLELSQEFDCAIVNCDSLQVYEGLDIGSAKPTLQERSQRPHFLFDVLRAPQVMTAGLYFEKFKALKTHLAEFQVVFVVGGTGFYFRALEFGLFDIQETPQDLKDEIKRQLAEPGGPQALWAELEARDPSYAKKIHFQDQYRLGRALEIIRREGTSLSEIQERFKSQPRGLFLPQELLKINLRGERKDLESRVRQRTQSMLQRGVVEETQALLQRGLRAWPPLKSVGYRECVDFIDGKITSEGRLVEAIVLSTLQLAKKQRTWFQKQGGESVPSSSSSTEILKRIQNHLTLT